MRGEAGVEKEVKKEEEGKKISHTAGFSLILGDKMGRSSAKMNPQINI